MVTSNKKTGFTLAETLVSMLILSIFFVAASKVISMKPKPESPASRHGYYECFKENGVLMQKRSDGSYGAAPTQAPNTGCVFTPPDGIRYAVIYVLNNSNVLGTNPSYETRFYNSVEPQFNTDNDNANEYDELRITLAQLERFQENLEDPGIGSSNIDSLANFFLGSYPSSSIYAKIKDNKHYSGPALFIGW